MYGSFSMQSVFICVTCSVLQEEAGEALGDPLPPPSGRAADALAVWRWYQLAGQAGLVAVVQAEPAEVHTSLPIITPCLTENAFQQVLTRALLTECLFCIFDCEWTCAVFFSILLIPCWLMRCLHQ